MAYAQFGYTSYSNTPAHQMLSVSTGGGPMAGSSVSSSCGSPRGITSPAPQSPTRSDSAIIPSSGPISSNSTLNRPSSPMASPSPPLSGSTSSTSVAQQAVYESRLLSSAYHHHHPTIHTVHHSHQVHPRLTSAGFYGASGGSGLHGSTTGTGSISYPGDSSVGTNAYQSLTSVDSSAFYPTLGSGFGMKDDPWRGGLTSTAHASANAHQTTASSYYYDPTLAAYGYGGLDFNGARRKNVTRDSTTTLKAWLGEHRKNPYPTKGEKIMLAIITKMTLTQVSTWFANARRRLKKENKMTWEPRNKVEADDHHEADDSQNESGRRSDDEDRKPNHQEVPLSAKEERLDKADSVKSSCVDDLGTAIIKRDDYDDRNRSLASCLSRTHSLDVSDPSLCGRNRGATMMGSENQTGPRLSSLALHSSYPGSVIGDFPGSCLQLPFSSVPNSTSSFRHHPHHHHHLGTETLITSPASQFTNRYQVSPDHLNALTSTASAFTPSTTSSSEGDSQDLLSCHALDAFIKDASLSSSASSEVNSNHSPMHGHDVSDGPYSPVIVKPKIWSLAATATSKSPPPTTNVQWQSSTAGLSHLGGTTCEKFPNESFSPNSTYQKHCQLNGNSQRDSFCSSNGLPYPSGYATDNWYAYHGGGRQQTSFQQSGATGRGFGSRSCNYSPQPPQTDTPPQTPPSLKVVGHQLNGYQAGDHHMYGNYEPHHQMHPAGACKASLPGTATAKAAEGSILADSGAPAQPQPRENPLDKPTALESQMVNGGALDVGQHGPGGEYHHQLSLPEEESPPPTRSTGSGQRREAVHGVTVLTGYRNCFGTDSEFEIP